MQKQSSLRSTLCKVLRLAFSQYFAFSIVDIYAYLVKTNFFSDAFSLKRKNWIQLDFSTFINHVVFNFVTIPSKTVAKNIKKNYKLVEKDVSSQKLSIIFLYLTENMECAFI